ncbi:uncharacterized protein LOC111320584 [Stylophora pistillata]|nr:uncharacterized protein LOC111320584 [Stylophora pistillata]
MAKLEIERVNQEREQDEEVSERSYGHVRTGSHRRLFRESNIEGKLHKPLRASKSIDSHDGFSSVNCIFTRIDEIRPLSAKAVPGARQREEKLPRVNTPPSSPINSPRMRRKLVPSPLNPERPGSPVLYPRSPSSPRPMSPLVCRSRSATSPGMRPSLAPSYNSPDLRRKAMTLSGGETRRERKMSKEMQDFLYSHYDRESKPWNVWKTVRKSQLDQFDVSDDDSSSEEENEKLAKFLKNSKSDRRKTFEMWLTDKEAQQIRRQTALAGMAKQEAIRKRKEGHWRQINGKTHQEWLEELRSDNMKSREPTEGEQSDERKVEAIRKYQEWLRAKDEEALKREDQLRKEAAAKFTESQQKRDEKLQRAWFKKKLFSTS